MERNCMLIIPFTIATEVFNRRRRYRLLKTAKGKMPDLDAVGLSRLSAGQEFENSCNFGILCKCLHDLSFLWRLIKGSR